MTEREAVGRGEGVNDWTTVLSVEHRQLLVKWLPSPRALFFSCMRGHIKLTVNFCFKVDHPLRITISSFPSFKRKFYDEFFYDQQLKLVNVIRLTANFLFCFNSIKCLPSDNFSSFFKPKF